MVAAWDPILELLRCRPTIRDTVISALTALAAAINRTHRDMQSPPAQASATAYQRERTPSARASGSHDIDPPVPRN